MLLLLSLNVSIINSRCYKIPKASVLLVCKGEKKTPSLQDNSPPSNYNTSNHEDRQTATA